VFTPTYASHLNRIECNFAAYKDFVINGSDFEKYDKLVNITRAYLQYRNHLHESARIRQVEKSRKVA